MTTQSQDEQVGVFRTILDLESRAHHIEEVVLRIKQAFLMNPGQVSVPDAVGLLGELHWSAKHTADAVRVLEEHIGIRRNPVSTKAAGVTPKPNHALRGSTRSIPMPDLIALLSSQRKTGTLYIKANEERFVLELLEGAVVHVVSDSPRKDQRIGDILVSQNKISTQELDVFLSKYCREDGRMGEALAKTQVVSEEDLRDALEYQVRELFRRVFSVEEALFSFTSGKVSDLQHRVLLNTTQLLLETARRQDEDVRDTPDSGAPDLAAAIDAIDPFSAATTANEPEAAAPTAPPTPDAAEGDAVEAAAPPDPAQDPAQDPSQDTPNQEQGLDEVAPPSEASTPAGDTAVAVATEDSATKTIDPADLSALQVVRGITRRTAKALILRNIRDIEDLSRASDRDLLSVPGIGHRTLRLIRQHCSRS